MTDNADTILQLYEKTLCRRLALLKVAEKSQGCSDFSLDQCADYLDLAMTGPERDRFEKHYTDCSVCLENLVSILEADRQCETDHRLTAIGCRISQRKALQHIADSRSGVQPQLLAAAARHRVSRCAAAGIGIDPRSGQGQILGCVAHIYEDGATEPGLQVIGSQVVEREIDGRRVGVTPPLRMIQDVMSVVCKSNAVFKKHRASERSITIQVTQPHESFLSEGLSLSLAAAAALYAAFEDVSLPDDLVMSGCLEITGRIGKVSHVREKAALAVQQGKTRMILAAENRMDVEKLDPGIRQKLSFSFVDTLHELFELLAKLAPGTKNAAVVSQPARHAVGRLVERLYRIDKYPLATGIFIFALCAGWLGGVFHEAADYFLRFWGSSGAVPAVIPVLTLLLCACMLAVAAQPGPRAGFARRMFCYALFLLLVPLGIASVKQIVPVHQVSVSISQNGTGGSEPLKEKPGLKHDALEDGVALQANLTLQVSPAQATVLIDGVRKQPSKDGIVSVTLKKGEHSLLVSAGAQYCPDERSIDLVSNMTIPIVLRSLEAGDAVTEQSLLLRRLAALKQHNPPFDITLWTDRQEYRISDTIAFNFKSERDCYLTLIDIATSGDIEILFPNRFHPHNFIQAGVTYRVPAEDYDFAFEVTGPRGTNRVKAIATLLDQPIFNYDFSRAAFHSVSNARDVQTVNAGMDKIQNGWTEAECSIRVR